MGDAELLALLEHDADTLTTLERELWARLRAQVDHAHRLGQELAEVVQVSAGSPAQMDAHFAAFEPAPKVRVRVA